MNLRLPRIAAVCLIGFWVGCGKPELLPVPEAADTRVGRWRQDVAYVCDNIARLHKDAFRWCDQGEYEAARDALLADVDTLSDAAIKVRLAGIIALLKDAHTTCVMAGSEFLTVPIEVAETSNGFFLGIVPEAQSQFLEGRIVSVGGVPIAEAIERIGTIVSHENAIRVRLNVPRMLKTPVVLQELGLANSKDAVEFGVEVASGLETARFEALPAGEGVPTVMIQREGQPWTDQRKHELYWFERVPDSNVVYMAYNACREDENRPMPGFAKAVLVALEDPAIDRIIIDLRRNPGGSQLVAWPLFKALKGHRLDRPGGILVLIGARTFSSAKGNALDLRDWTDAVLIGNPIGQRPNSFGEIKTFESPNFGITASYSTKYFVRGSEEDDTVMPDVRVPLTLDQWKHGVDAVFDAALAYQPE